MLAGNLGEFFSATARYILILVNRNSIQKLMAMVPSTLSWKLMDRDPLETWIHKDGKLVLLGDSCHPMLVGLIISVQ